MIIGNTFVLFNYLTAWHVRLKQYYDVTKDDACSQNEIPDDKENVTISNKKNKYTERLHSDHDKHKSSKPDQEHKISTEKKIKTQDYDYHNNKYKHEKVRDKDKHEKDNYEECRDKDGHDKVKDKGSLEREKDKEKHNERHREKSREKYKENRKKHHDKHHRHHDKYKERKSREKHSSTSSSSTKDKYSHDKKRLHSEKHRHYHEKDKNREKSKLNKLSQLCSSANETPSLESQSPNVLLKETTSDTAVSTVNSTCTLPKNSSILSLTSNSVNSNNRTNAQQTSGNQSSSINSSNNSQPVISDNSGSLFTPDKRVLLIHKKIQKVAKRSRPSQSSDVLGDILKDMDKNDLRK